MARLNEVEYRAAQTALASGQITDPARAARFKDAVVEYESEQAAKGAVNSSGAQVPYWEAKAEPAPAMPERSAPMSKYVQMPTPEAAQSIPEGDDSEEAMAMRHIARKRGQLERPKEKGKPQVSTRPVDAFTDYTKPPLVYHDKPELKPEENDARYNELVQAGVREGSRVMRERDLAPSEKLAMDTAENVMAGVAGADKSLTGGLGMELGSRLLEAPNPFDESLGGLVPTGYREEMIEGAMERSPVAATVGAVGGAVMGGPGSVAGVADRLGVETAKRLLPNAAKSAAGRIAQGGVRGAVSGATGAVAQGAVEDAVELGGNAIGGGYVPTTGEAAGDMLDRMGDRILWGGAFGAPFGALGEAGGEMKRMLREEPGLGADLKRIEDSGGGTDIVRGVRAPESVKPLIAEAGEKGGYPEILARDKAFPLLSERLDDEIDTTRKLTQRETADFNQGPSGGEKAPLRKSSEEAMNVIRSLRASDGKLLPLADGGPAKEFLQRTLDAEVVPASSPLLDEIDPEAVIPLESAAEIGLSVKAPPKKDASSILDPYGKPFADDDVAEEYVVVLRPRALTGQEMQDTITYLSSGIKDSSVGKRSADDEAIFKRLRAAVLEDRNQIANGTFSDLKQSQHLRLKKLEQQLQAAGMDAKANEVDIEVLKTEEGLKKAIMSFGEKGNEPRDRLLLEVAKNNQDLKDALEAVAATKATQRLRGKAGPKAVVHEGGVTGYGSMGALRLHSDPIWNWFNTTPALRRGTVGGAAIEDED